MAIQKYTMFVMQLFRLSSITDTMNFYIHMRPKMAGVFGNFGVEFSPKMPRINTDLTAVDCICFLTETNVQEAIKRNPEKHSAFINAWGLFGGVLSLKRSLSRRDQRKHLQVYREVLRHTSDQNNTRFCAVKFCFCQSNRLPSFKR